MPLYTWLVTDDRYRVPSLIFNVAPDDATVRTLVHLDLANNPHHRAIEVRDGDKLMFVESRDVWVAT